MGSSRKKIAGEWTKSAGDFDAAAHTSREVLHIRLHATCVRSTSSSNSLICFSRLPLRDVVELRVRYEVLFDRELEVTGHRLRDDADGASRCICIFRDVIAIDERPPRCDRNERGHHTDQRALACAVWPQEPEYLSTADTEADIIDGGEVPIALHDVVDDDGAVGWLCLWSHLAFPCLERGMSTSAVIPGASV